MLETVKNFLSTTGIARLFENTDWWQTAIMFLIAFVLVYLAIVKQFEPMGTHVTTVVLDVEGYTNVKYNTKQWELLEYSISMLREIFEYFEAKRIPYCLYTNAKSSYVHDMVFKSVPSGKKTRDAMLCMLGDLSVKLEPKERIASSKDLLDFSIKNSFRAPFTYIAPTDHSKITTALKKISKIKGIEIIEFYAKDYYSQG